MGGRAPISIMTDQDRAMIAAIAKVFPYTRHRFCLWHIADKFPRKFCQVIKKNPNFSDELQLLISCSYRIEYFEEGWQAFMLKYDFLDDSWVKELYDLRSKWVPAFHLNTFYAGMNTTGRSESMNAMYDNFVNHNTNLIDFVLGCDRLLDKIVCAENEHDFRTEHKTPIVRESGAFLLQNAAEVYTKAVFLKFQKQWNFSVNVYIIVKEEVQGDGYTTFTLRSRNTHNPNYWIMNFNRTTLQGKCECKYFEFMGLPCGHLLRVWRDKEGEKIPVHYILRRWTQRANTYRSMFSNDGSRATGPDDFGALKATNVCRVTTELAANFSHDDDYEYAMEIFKMMYIEVDRRKEARNAPREDTPSDLTMNGDHVLDPTQILLLNPNISQTKGRQKHAVRYKKGGKSTINGNSP